MRYRVRKRPVRSFDDDEQWFPDRLITSLEVDDVVITWTGLYDENGDEIYRVPDRIGFHNPLGDDDE